MNERRSARRGRLNYFVTVRDRITGLALGRIIDISGNGMRLFGEEHLGPGEVHRLQIELPRGYDRSQQLLCDATGIWNAPDLHPDFPGFYDTGLRLVDISNPDRLLLEDLIRDYTHRPA